MVLLALLTSVKYNKLFKILLLKKNKSKSIKKKNQFFSFDFLSNTNILA